jgi:large conductance mechanosensitive channel
MRHFFREFWKFAAKGNVMDLAIAVILGNAFSAVVNSLVADILMPLLSLATGNINLSSFSYELRAPLGTIPAVSINYGHLLQSAVNFLIIALSIFVMFKVITNVRKRLVRDEAEQGAPTLTTEERLLTEIRDLLKTP